MQTAVSDIQRAISHTSVVTEQGTQAAELGVQQSLQAGESIKALSTSILESLQAMSQIAVSSQQHLIGMDQVVSAMKGIREATSCNVAGVRQIETTARNLHHVGQRLTFLIMERHSDGSTKNLSE